MSNKKTLTLGAIAVAMVAVVGISAISLAAETTNPDSPSDFKNRQEWRNSEKFEAKKAEREAIRQSVMAALDNNDYQAWLEAVGSDSQIAQQVSEEEFPRLVEAHSLMQQAHQNMQKAREIKEEIGLDLKPKGPAKKFMKHGFNP